MTKKQLIIEKSLELFAKQGFEATSVQQITELCGISKGAFYLSFKTKDELILALIDHFMMQIISDVDHIVRSTGDGGELLYDFYHAIFSSFLKHSDFAKVFVKEQMQSFNEELVLKTRYYDKLMEQIILSMIEGIYGENVDETKYDLIYSIKSLMNAYSFLFLFYNLPLDLDALAKSLVEKTNILAKHTTIPFLSEHLFQMVNRPMNEETTKEQIIEMIEQEINEIQEESIERESLILLRQDLIEPAFSRAMIKGLLENIRKHPHCKWISYLLRSYYAFNE